MEKVKQDVKSAAFYKNKAKFYYI